MDPHTSSYKFIVEHTQPVVVQPVSLTDNQRILPRQLSSGAMRGTQRIGYGDARLDGSNNQIVIGGVTNTLGEQAETVLGDLTPNNLADKSFGLRVTDANGTSVTYGLLSDGSPGMEITDSSGFVLFKLTGTEWNWFDKNYNTNTLRVGLLPDGNYGWVAVPVNQNVTNAISS